MNRRVLMIGVSTIGLMSCADGIKVPVSVPISIDLPPEAQTAIDYVKKAVAKVEKLADIPTVLKGYIADAKNYVTTAVASVDWKTLLAKAATLMAQVSGSLPAPYNLVSVAIDTLMPFVEKAVGITPPVAVAARRRSSRTAMTPGQALAVLES